MYFFGHIGIMLLISFMLFFPMLFALIGSMLPDAIDKPLFLLGLAPSGRYISHTLLFVAVSFAATYLATKKVTAASALSLGVLLHLSLDMEHSVPWFYPFVDYVFEPYAIIFRFDPFLISAEIIGIILLFAIVKYGVRLDAARSKLRSKFRK